MVRVSAVASLVLVLVLVCRTTSRATLTSNGYNNVLVAISPEVGKCGDEVIDSIPN